jgi:hypothetical protein
MTKALAAAPSELDRMGRAGAVRVADRHRIEIGARKLASLFVNPRTAPPRPDQRSPLASTGAMAMAADVPPYSANGGVRGCLIEQSLMDNPQV